MTDWVIDLDGVMWRGDDPIPGSLGAVRILLERGDRVLFCTNNSTLTGEMGRELLSRRGLPGDAHLVTSSDAACTLVERGERVLVLGSEALSEALAGAAPDVVRTHDLVRRLDQAGGWGDPEAVLGKMAGFDAVVVGMARGIDYPALDLACGAVHEGARLIATGRDPTFPIRGRLQPGTGAIVAAVEAATGQTAEVAGKPHRAMAELIRSRLRHPEAAASTVGASTVGASTAGASTAGASPQRSAAVVVGDRPDTDGLLAAELGWPFALVLSGATSRIHGDGARAAVVAADLAALVAGEFLEGSLPALADEVVSEGGDGVVDAGVVDGTVVDGTASDGRSVGGS